MAEVDIDKDLLFGLMALQSNLIDARQLADSCHLHAAGRGSTLADTLVQQGHLLAEDRRHLEYLLERRIEKQGGSAHETLSSISIAMPAAARTAILTVNDPAIRARLSAVTPPPSATTSVSTQTPERVTLKGLHASGGIGQVWIAHDQLLDREIALKELKPGNAASIRSRERFFREAQLTGQLEHPGIVPVYDYTEDRDGGRCFYTMRFVKGGTLTEVITSYHAQRTAAQDGAAISGLIRLLNIFVRVCQTIAYAHSRNVIHRDLKGDNVIVGDFGEVMVLDWGLAKRLDRAHPESAESTVPEQASDSSEAQIPGSSRTMQGERLGTPLYMAPEQARGNIDEIDQRTDVYGLAAMLYEILAGEPPFGGSPLQILNRVIHEPPERPSERIAGIPVELERVCLQGLSKSRSDRQQTAAELANQVQGWIVNQAERKRTEQERERFFSLSLDMLGIVDAQGTLTQTNPAWETVLGYSAPDLIGKTVWQLVHPDEHQLLTRNLERILHGESLIAVEHRCICKDGTQRWVLWNARLIAGEDAIYIVGRDITERKHSEQKFQELLESAPDGMVIVNQHGRIVLANAQLERMFGYQREELLGQPIEILVPDEVRNRHPEYVARFIAAPECRPMASGLKLCGRRKDGRVFPAEISLSPVKTEQGLLVSCAIRDVGLRQSVERQL